MIELQIAKLKSSLLKESEEEQVYLLSLFNRMVGLHPNIRRWVEKPISDGESYMAMPEDIMDINRNPKEP